MGVDLKLIIPLIVIQLIVMLIGLIDLVKIDKEKIKGENKFLWAAIIAFIGFIGPSIYLTMGKKKR